MCVRHIRVWKASAPVCPSSGVVCLRSNVCTNWLNYTWHHSNKWAAHFEHSTVCVCWCAAGCTTVRSCSQSGCNNPTCVRAQTGMCPTGDGWADKAALPIHLCRPGLRRNILCWRARKCTWTQKIYVPYLMCFSIFYSHSSILCLFDRMVISMSVTHHQSLSRLNALRQTFLAVCMNPTSVSAPLLCCLFPVFTRAFCLKCCPLCIRLFF
jgi:hypothetical protein